MDVTENGWDRTNPQIDLEKEERKNRDELLNSYIDIVNAVRWESLTQQQKDEFISYRSSTS